MILFSDFDKTLYFRDDDEKTKRNFDAIKKWKEKGNQFCIVTGRSYKSITEHSPETKNLCDYFIVDSGSIITSKTGEILKAFFFDDRIVKGIIELSRTLPEIPIAYYYSPNSEGVDMEPENTTKLRLWFKDINLLENVVRRIRNSFPVFAFRSDPVVQSHNDLIGCNAFVEIIPIELGKGNAIRILLDQLNISPSDAITVGDGLNDYGMVQNFDGYAIENSELATKFKSLRVTSSISSLINDLEER